MAKHELEMIKESKSSLPGILDDWNSKDFSKISLILAEFSRLFEGSRQGGFVKVLGKGRPDCTLGIKSSKVQSWAKVDLTAL